MRKLFVGLMVLMMLMLCVGAAVAEASGDDYEYAVLEDGTVEITRYSGNDTEVVIPEELDGKTVTSIGYRAFAWRSNITSIYIPDCVTSIGDYAFYHCFGLTSISISDNVSSIGANPFSSCGNLATIIVSPDSSNFAIIDGVLFEKATNTIICYPKAKSDAEFTIPNDIRSIGDRAFFFCTSLTSVSIPDSVTSIAESAFSDCSNLTSVSIPNSVAFIDKDAFKYCSPDLVITVSRDSYAAQYCKENNLAYVYPD